MSVCPLEVEHASNSHVKAPEKLTHSFLGKWNNCQQNQLILLHCVETEGRDRYSRPVPCCSTMVPMLFSYIIPPHLSSLVSKAFKMRRNRKFFSLSSIPMFIKHIPAYDPAWSSGRRMSCSGQSSLSPFHRFIHIWGCSNCSVVTSTGCSHREPGFNSRHTHGVGGI